MSALDFAAIAALVPGTEAKASDNGQPWLLVPAAELPRVARLLRDDPALRFDSLADLTGWDLSKYPSTTPSSDIAVVYYLHSLAHRHHVTLKILAPREACAVPSVSGIWPVAVYFEREVFDLLGVVFTGHPSLKRIMCPDDWTGHALRKDYVYPSAYNGVPCLREGQKFEEPPARGGAS
jgi:NADH-quinone oxidoreductase subunit C